MNSKDALKVASNVGSISLRNKKDIPKVTPKKRQYNRKNKPEATESEANLRLELSVEEQKEDQLSFEI